MSNLAHVTIAIFAVAGLTMTDSAYAQSKGDMLIANRTGVQFVLMSVSQPSAGTVTYSANNTTNPTILPPNTDKNTLSYSGPIKTNISYSFSYRDYNTRSYGCDFAGFLNYTYTSSGSIDHYTLNFSAYTAVSSAGHATCTAETSSQQTVGGGAGANFGGVYFIKP